jgi:hypothetical protein
METIIKYIIILRRSLKLSIVVIYFCYLCILFSDVCFYYGIIIVIC